MDKQTSPMILVPSSTYHKRSFRPLVIVFLFLLFSYNYSLGQTVLLSDPGMTYTNTDMPTGPDIYSVNVSTCTSISFSVDFSFSLPWEGGGNMEFCNEISPVTGQPVCFTTATPCACDPTTPTAGSCSGCWDFLWVNFNLDGSNVGGDLIGDAGTTDADQFGTISTGPICTNGAATADIDIVTQTWAGNESVTFTNLMIVCWEGAPTVSTNDPICAGDNVDLMGTVTDPVVVNNWMWSNTGTGVIANPSVPNTIATTPSTGDTYTLVTTDVNSCTGSDDVTITIFPSPNTGVPSGPVSDCNSTNNLYILNDLLAGEDVGGTWTETSVPTSSSFNPVPGTFNPLGENPGTYTFEYSIAGVPPCLGSSSTVTFNISAAPEAGNPNPPITECNTNNNLINLNGELSGQDAGGTWIETSVPSSTSFNPVPGTFNPLGEAAGTYTFQYTVPGVPPCPNDVAVVTINVNAGPNAGTPNPPTTTCNNVMSPIDLNGELFGQDPGGAWTETSAIPSSGGAFNPVPGTFNPNMQPAGTYTFQYELIGLFPCTNVQSTVTIIVQAAANPGIPNPPLSVCPANAPIVLTDELTGADPGGTWSETSIIPSISGVNPIIGVFNPAGESPGTYTFEYTITGAPPCADVSATVTIIITPGVSAGTANPPIDLCNSSLTPVSLFDQLTGEDMGGTWMETSIIPTISGVNAVTGIFIPTGEAAGVYTFEYTVLGVPPCPDDSETITITIIDAPEAGDANLPMIICDNSTTPIFLFNELIGADPGGTWTETSFPTSISGVDPILGIFDPTGEAPGSYSFLYEIIGVPPCPNSISSVSIIIEPGPDAGTANPPITICNNSTTPISLFDELMGEDTGGTWTETSIIPTTSGVNAVTGIFNPTGEAVGTYTFEYSVTGTAPCLNDTETVTINIQASPDPGTPNPPMTICDDSTNPIPLFDELTGETSGGMWTETSAAPSTNGVDAITGIFDPTGEAPGTYTFEYSITGVAPCPNATASVTVIIQAAPSAGTANPPITVCNNSMTPISLSDELTGETSGGTWTETSATPSTSGVNAITGIFNPIGESAGTYTFEYSVTGIATCPSDMETVTIIIEAAPNAGTANPPLSVCNNSTTPISLFDELIGETSGGTWTETSATPSTNGVNAISGFFDPMGEAAGTYTFEYSVTGIAPCPNDTETVTVIIEAAPSAGTANPPLSVCNSSTIPIALFDELTGETSGGTWTETSATPSTSGVNATSGIFNPMGEAAGTYTFEYSITGIAPCLNDTETVTIIIEAAPNAGTANPPLSVCNSSTILIALFDELTGETSGGTWTETSATPSTNGVNALSGIFNPMGESAGTYTFEYSVTGIAPCLNDSETVTVIIEEEPVATVISNATICDLTAQGSILDFTSFVTAGDMGGAWSELVTTSGVTLIPINAVDFDGVTPGTYTFTYTTASATAPCTEQTYQIDVLVQDCACPDVATTAPDDLCNDDDNLDLTTLVTTVEPGSWAITAFPVGGSTAPLSGNIFDATAAIPGDYEITYTLNIAPIAGCPDSSVQVITVHPIPLAGTALADLEVCDSDNTLVILNDRLSGETSGGTWTETSTTPSTGGAFNPILGTFNPSAQNAGTYTFNYLVNGITPCPSVNNTVSIIIHPEPSATVSTNASICNLASQGSVLDFNSFVTAGDMGGSWSELVTTSGVNLVPINAVDFNGVTAGTYTFTYTTASATAPCTEQTYQIDILVQDCACPDVATAAPGDLCNDDDNLDLTTLVITVEPGTWAITAFPIGGSTAPLSGNIFDATAAIPGDYEITYTLNIAPIAGCPDSSVQVITVHPIPLAGTALADLEVCDSDNTLVILNDRLTGETNGGTWTETSTTPSTGGAFNPIPGTFNPSSQNAGTYTFNYLLNGTAPCPSVSNTVSIIVHPEPSATVSTNATICNLTSQGSILDFNSFVTAGDMGGSWSELVTTSGVNLIPINAVDFDGVPAGTYTFTYTTASATAPCTEQTYQIDILVQNCACPDVATSAPSDLCNDNDNLDLTTLVITVEPGTWAITGFPVGGSTTPLSGNIFDATAAVPGDYEITYTLGIAPIAGCPDSSVQVLTVHPIPSATVSSNATICNLTSQGSILDFNSFVTAGDMGGSWSELVTTSGVNLIPINAVDFDGVPAGTYTFTYTTASATAPCTEQTYQIDILVQDCACPDVATSAPSDLCNDNDNLDLTTLVITAEPGTWAITGFPVGGSTTPLSGNIFDATAAVPGDYEITYTLGIAPIAGCPDSSVQVLTVHPIPSATVSSNATICNLTSQGSILDFNSFVTAGDMGGSWSELVTTSGVNLIPINAVDFDGVAPGTYTFTYTTASAVAPCTEQTYQIDILVQNCACPDVATSAPADLCNDNDNIDLSTLVITAEPGTWAITGFPVGGSTAPLSGNIFDAASAISGDYEITYTLNIAPIIGCPDSSVQTLTVIDAPNSGIAGSTIEICNSSNTDILVNDLLTGEDAGGTWIESSVVPSTGIAWDPIAGTFNPSGQLAGLYTFQYTVTGSSPCGSSFNTVSIQVQARPLATVQTSDTICNLTALGSILDFTNYVTGGDLGGTWTTTLGVDLTNLSSVDFDGIPAGSYDFTYTTNSAIAPCTEQAYTLVIVVESCACPSVETIAPGPLCNNESVDLNTFLITTESGTWSITGMPAPPSAILTGSIFDAAGATPGIYEITFTLDNPSGTCPISSSQNITVQGAANAGMPGSTSICNPQMGQEIDLYNLLTMSTTGGIWTADPTSPNTPLAGALNPLTGAFDAFNHPNGTYVFIYVVVGSPLCPPSTTTATVTVNNVDISINGNLDFCPGDTTDLFATFGFANYNWSVPGNNTSMLEVFAAGNYSVTVSDATNCSDEATVLVTELIAPSGNLDTILCVGDSLIINSTVYNAANPMGSEILDDMASNGCDSILAVTVSYYQVADSTLQETLCPGDFRIINGTTYDINNPTGTETIPDASQYGCDSTVIINLSFIPEMIAGITGDPVICSGDTATLTFNFTGQGPFDIEYSDATNTVPLNGLTNGATIQVVVTNSTTFTLTNVSSSANPTCAVQVPINSFTIDVTQVDLVASVDSDFNGYGVSCPDSDNGVLSATADNGTGPYVYTWDNGGNGALLENVGAGTYLVSATDANGCTSESVISLTAPPEPLVDLLAEEPSCYGDSDGILIISDITGPGSNYNFSVDGDPFQSVGNLPFLLSGLPSGIYDLAVEDENNCRLDQTITIPQANEIGLELGENLIIELGDSVWLSPVTNIDSFSWEWNNLDYLSCEDCLDPFAKPFNTTSYSLTIRDSMGCEATDDIIIQVRTDINIYIPNGFSPDNNGDNDYFFVQSGRNDIQIKNMSIYDRWGEVVFSRNNFGPNIADLGWDGTFAGKKLNPAVFVYVVELEYINGQVEVLSGDVTLVR